MRDLFHEIFRKPQAVKRVHRHLRADIFMLIERGIRPIAHFRPRLADIMQKRRHPHRKRIALLRCVIERFYVMLEHAIDVMLVLADAKPFAKFRQNITQEIQLFKQE